MNISVTATVLNVSDDFSLLDDACVLQSIGWMGNDFEFTRSATQDLLGFEFNNTTIGADLAGLDEVILAAFEGYDQCVEDMVGGMATANEG